MIPILLQDELEKRMKDIFSNFTLKNPNNEYIPLNIFQQHLPERKSNNAVLYPYVLIKLVEGEQENQTDPQKVQVVFIVGVFDDDKKYQGYRDVSTIIEKIYQNLVRNPLISGDFQLEFPIKWAFHEEDAYPYYFGGIETNWEVPIALRDDVEDLI